MSLSEAESNLQSEGKVPFFKFVLTGGPCAGKTTALARIFSYLRERGFECITCPEAFTILSSNGLSLDFFGTDGMDTVIQNSVMDVQIAMEDGLETVLKARGRPAVLMCDRGPMDGAAYLSEEKWDAIMEKRGVDVTDLRDKRYNAVLHLVTAADGAASYYKLEGVRSETPDHAIELDKKTQKAWTGHAHMYVFDNSTDFEGKLQRIVDRISRLVGLPSTPRSSVKFLLKCRPNPRVDFPQDVLYHIFDVEKVYLVNQDTTTDKEVYSFIRKRITVDNKQNRRGEAYQLTTVQRNSEGALFEQKRIISSREYNTAYKSRDLSRHIIRQERISFLYKLQSFAIHIYDTPCKGMCTLHAQVEMNSTDDIKVDLPPFLKVDRRLQGVADEQQFGAYSLSLINKERSEISD